MFSNIFYIILALIVTFVGTYYLSGLYFYLKKLTYKRKDIMNFEEKIKILEETCNNQTAFQKLGPEQQKLFLESIAKKSLSRVKPSNR